MAIYVHFPFCTNLCSYCDFYKERFQPQATERYFRALMLETEMALSAFGHEPVDVASVYIGGGTPSLADPALLSRWISVLGSYVRFMPDYEFTIEANPESVTENFVRTVFDAGVNRIIIGVQSFAPGVLARLNRRQQTRDVYQAFYLARAAGFDNIGADLIFGLPGQRVRHVHSDIDRLAALEPQHISFYQLTVEQGTRLAREVADGTLLLANDERSAAMYLFGSHLLHDRGYRRYEVSNFANEGFRSRHNYAYWNFSPYIGLGPGAHGFVNNHRYANVADLTAYIEAVEGGHFAVQFVEELTADQRLMEAVMLWLRTADGIDKEKLTLQFGAAGTTILDGSAAARYAASGHLIDDAGFMRLSDDGFLVADKIIADLVG